MAIPSAFYTIIMYLQHAGRSAELKAKIDVG